MTESTGQKIIKSFEKAAREWQAENPGMTYAKAFTEIYTDPDNHDLAMAERRENGFVGNTAVTKAAAAVAKADIDHADAMGTLQKRAADLQGSASNRRASVQSGL